MVDAKNKGIIKENAVVICVLTKKTDSLNRKIDEINRLCFSSDLNVVKNFHQNITQSSSNIENCKIKKAGDYKNARPPQNRNDANLPAHTFRKRFYKRRNSF